jgi:hypothetical protein
MTKSYCHAAAWQVTHLATRLASLLLLLLLVVVLVVLLVMVQHPVVQVAVAAAPLI